MARSAGGSGLGCPRQHSAPVPWERMLAPVTGHGAVTEHGAVTMGSGLSLGTGVLPLAHACHGARGCHRGLAPVTGHSGVTAGSCLPPRAARWRPCQHFLLLLIGVSRGLLPFLFPPGDQTLGGTVFEEEESLLCRASPCQSDGLCHGFAWPLSCGWFDLSKSRHVFVCLKSRGSEKP